MSPVKSLPRQTSSPRGFPERGRLRVRDAGLDQEEQHSDSLIINADDQFQVLVITLSERLGRVVERHDVHAVADRLQSIVHVQRQSE